MGTITMTLAATGWARHARMNALLDSQLTKTFRLSPLMYSLLPLMCLGAFSAPVMAATPASQAAANNDPNNRAAPSTTLDTIVVTANPLYKIDPSEDNDLYNANVATVGTKTPDYLENIPQSISVITQSKIDDLNVDTLDQIAKRTPGLRVLQNDDGRSSIFSRGYEYDQYSIDGLAAPMASINGTLPNLSAFDRVEVMRGPSGLFNSASEMGGVVNLVRKRGKADGPQTLKVSVGDPKSYGLSADIQGALGSDDSLVGRTVIEYNQRANPLVEAVGGNDNKNGTLYASIDKRLNESTKFGVGYLLQDRKISPNNGLPTYQDSTLISLPNDDFYGAKWNDFNSRSHDVFADLQHRLGRAGVVSAGVRYSNRDADYNYAFAGSAVENGKVNVAGTSADMQQSSLSADINLSQPFATGATQSEYVVGADYKRFNSDRQTGATRALAKGFSVTQINDLPYVDILNQAKSGQKGFRYSHSDNTLTEMGLYAKVNYNPLIS